MMMADSSQMRSLEGWWSVLACWFVSVLESVPWCSDSTALWTFRWRFGLRMVGRLHTLSGCCVFSLWLHACLPWTYVWLFLTDEYWLSWSEAPCCHHWWLIPACTSVNSLQLVFVMLSWSSMTMLSFFLLGAYWRRLLWACTYCLPSLQCNQPSTNASEAKWLLCLAGCLSSGFL